jgi:hypothetical protein
MRPRREVGGIVGLGFASAECERRDLHALFWEENKPT